jgi:RNA polymerase sigma-70 factor (ECF subfamily)
MAIAELTDTLKNATLDELVCAAQEGDRDAFGEIVVRFQNQVYAQALRRLRNEVEAQELTQEVFMQAMRKISQLRSAESLGGWLRSITVRMAINRMVRVSPVIPTEPETLAATCVESQTPLDDALLNERRDQLHAGLDRLGAMDRDTLVAFYLNGQSLAEMSDAFESPVGTIKRRLHVARKRLAKTILEVAAL